MSKKALVRYHFVERIAPDKVLEIVSAPPIPQVVIPGRQLRRAS